MTAKFFRLMIVPLLAAITVLTATGPAQAAVPENLLIWLLNEQSDKCLNQDHTDNVERKEIIAWPCSTHLNGRWTIKPVSGKSGVYTIVNGKSLKCLNQDYTNNVKHAQVIAWPCTAGALNEQWRIEWLSDGVRARLVNQKSLECLNQDYTGGVERKPVIAYTCNRTNNGWQNDQWTFWTVL